MLLLLLLPIDIFVSTNATLLIIFEQVVYLNILECQFDLFYSTHTYFLE